MAAMYGYDDFGKKIVRDESASEIRERDERRRRGRYELQEAAELIAESGAGRPHDILDYLLDAASNEVFPMFRPEEDIPVRYRGNPSHEVRQFYEQARWCDLNAWLEKQLPHVAFRFAGPSGLRDDDFSSLREEVYNGGPIDWRYWNSVRRISASQAAKLALCIDPIKHSQPNEYQQGVIPSDLREELARLELWLDSRESTWTLASLAAALSGNVPTGMLDEVKTRPPANPPVVPDAAAPGNQPLQTGLWRQREITRVLTLLQINPKALPQGDPGKPGVKSRCKEALLSENASKWRGKTFDKAWEDMRSRGDLRDEV